MTRAYPTSLARLHLAGIPLMRPHPAQRPSSPAAHPRQGRARLLSSVVILASLVLPVALLPRMAAAQGIDLSKGGPVSVTASNGIEWRQNDQVVIARGNAKAVRDGATVDADTLIARYRPTPGAAGTTTGTASGTATGTSPEQTQAGNGAASNGASGSAAGAKDSQASSGSSPLSGNNQIWRMEADGHVRITSSTDVATGDHAVYDMDKAVLVLTGKNLSLTTQQDKITARDTLEYWSQKRMAVARGNAVVTSGDRRIYADTLVAYFIDDPEQDAAARKQQPVRATPAAAAGTPAAGTPAAGATTSGTKGATDNSGATPTGKLDRVEAFGNVEIRTATEVVRGDRGVYSPRLNMARLIGNVRITRGDNQLNGQEAIVNLKTGVSRLVSTGGGRVQGLVVPQNQNQTPGAKPNTSSGTTSGGTTSGGAQPRQQQNSAPRENKR